MMLLTFRSTIATYLAKLNASYEKALVLDFFEFKWPITQYHTS
jgi:hypothetical protein